MIQCTISVAKILKDYAEPVFYDIFLKYHDEEDGQQYLWAVPVLNVNLKYNEIFVNQGKNILFIINSTGTLNLIHTQLPHLNKTQSPNLVLSEQESGLNLPIPSLFRQLSQ